MEAFALSPDVPRVALPQRMLSDERLLRSIAAGNSQAFGAVYARYHAPLYAYCRSIVRDPDDARDALQNTMLKALAALNRGGGREVALKPWLFRIAHNESISLLRRRRPSEPLTDAVSPPVAGADRVAISRERLAQLVADLQELPERQRGALLMREVNGLSYEDIAATFAISEGAARQTVFEARTALAEYGQGREVACEQIRSISDGDGRALRARRVRAHLRACDGCRDFHDGVRARRRELAVLTPGLSAGSALALLQSVLGGGVVGTAGGLGAGAGLLGGGGAGVLASGATKGLVALVAVTAAGAGAAGIEAPAKHRAAVAPTHALPAPAHAAPAAVRSTRIAAPVTVHRAAASVVVRLAPVIRRRRAATVEPVRRQGGAARHHVDDAVAAADHGNEDMTSAVQRAPRQDRGGGGADREQDRSRAAAVAPRQPDTQPDGSPTSNPQRLREQAQAQTPPPATTNVAASEAPSGQPPGTPPPS